MLAPQDVAACMRGFTYGAISGYLDYYRITAWKDIYQRSDSRNSQQESTLLFPIDEAMHNYYAITGIDPQSIDYPTALHMWQLHQMPGAGMQVADIPLGSH